MTEPSGWQIVITAAAEVVPGEPVADPDPEQGDEQEGEQE